MANDVAFICARVGPAWENTPLEKKRGAQSKSRRPQAQRASNDMSAPKNRTLRSAQKVGIVQKALYCTGNNGAVALPVAATWAAATNDRCERRTTDASAPGNGKAHPASRFSQNTLRVCAQDNYITYQLTVHPLRHSQ
jgi:hypothetical protein